MNCLNDEIDEQPEPPSGGPKLLSSLDEGPRPLSDGFELVHWVDGQPVLGEPPARRREAVRSLADRLTERADDIVAVGTAVFGRPVPDAHARLARTVEVIRVLARSFAKPVLASRNDPMA